MKRVALALAGLASTVALAQQTPSTPAEPRTSAAPQEQTAPADSRRHLSEADKQMLMNDCMRQVEADNPKVPEKDVRGYCDEAVKRYAQPRG